MNRSELFEIWAPPASVWSQWAKPSLFAEMPVDPGPPPEASRGKPRIALDARMAIVVDLPGAESVQLGLELAEIGYRPVPLFNSAYHPAGVIDVDGIARSLVKGAGALASAPIPAGAPPAFLVDSGRRKGAKAPSPGRFDNRWVVFPQDFPSARFLLANGIGRTLLFQVDSGAQPHPDLAHVLLRWQEAGIEIFARAPGYGEQVQPLRVHRPSNFRSLWHRALALIGLRRSSAGGFGSIIPEPSRGYG